MASKYDSHLDHEELQIGASEPKSPPSTEHERPNRVLALAFIAVIVLLIAVHLSIDVLWNLSGERYAHEVFGEAFQNARTTPSDT
jgi:hypothetical protein